MQDLDHLRLPPASEEAGYPRRLWVFGPDLSDALVELVSSGPLSPESG
jgi:hypothetical protein